MLKLGKPYGIVRGENVVAFYMDVISSNTRRAYVASSTSQSLNGVPEIDITDGREDVYVAYVGYDDSHSEHLSIAFPELSGYQFHSSSGGKTLSLCFIKQDFSDKGSINFEEISCPN